MPLRIILKRELDKRAATLSKMIDKDKDVNAILKAIALNKLDAAMQMISCLEDNSQRNLMNQICERLKKDEEHKRQSEWISSALWHIDQLFTYSKKELEQRFTETLSVLVKYTGANQGAIFLVNEEQENTLSLKACYAYGKKKFIEKEFDIHEGLVGQCFLEQAPILLSEIPKDYIRITSGLGEALPGFITLFPMSAKDVHLGVIELAYFEKPADHVIKFITGICERLAYSIAGILKSKRNEKLLLESKSLSEKLIVKEESMKQMIEEMNAIQEELERKNAFLEESKLKIQSQQDELLRLQKEDSVLMENKIQTQQIIHDKITEKLRSKILQLEMALSQKHAFPS